MRWGSTHLARCLRSRGSGDAEAALSYVAVKVELTVCLFERQGEEGTYTSNFLGLKKLTFHASTSLHVGATLPARSLRSAIVDTAKPAPKIGIRGTARDGVSPHVMLVVKKMNTYA